MVRENEMRTDFSIRRLVAVLAVAIPFALGSAAAAADGYTVVELGALRQNGSSVGRHMDSTGTRVVGSSGLIHGSDTRAFLWSAPTGMRDLGTFQGGNYSQAFGVNDSGNVVGDSNTRENIRAFIWNAWRECASSVRYREMWPAVLFRSTTRGRS